MFSMRLLQIIQTIGNRMSVSLNIKEHTFDKIKNYQKVNDRLHINLVN